MTSDFLYLLLIKWLDRIRVVVGDSGLYMSRRDKKNIMTTGIVPDNSGGIHLKICPKESATISINLGVSPIIYNKVGLNFNDNLQSMF